VSDILQNFDEAAVISPANLLHKYEFTIQFSEEYHASTLHWHDYAQIWYVSEGMLTHRINNMVYTQTPGSVVFVSPYSSHFISSLDSDIAPRYCQISLTDSFLTRNGFDFFTYHREYAHFDKKIIPQYIRFSDSEKSDIDYITSELYYEFSKDNRRSLKKLSILLAELLSKITFNSEKLTAKGFRYIVDRANAVTDSVRYMATHYPEKITLDKLCSISHMSRSFLTENFRDVTKRSAFEILTSIRLCNAFRSLLFSDLTLSKIAENVGLTTKSRLSHEFTKRIGITPIEYRRRLQHEYLERDEKLAAYWEKFDHLDT